MISKRKQNRYIALLRAVNVGGNSIMSIESLKKLFESLGFSEVVTYIQTGNVLFGSTENNVDYLAHEIENKIFKTLGYKTKLFVLSPEELEEAALNNPFQPEKHEKTHRNHLMFLSGTPEEALKKELMTLQDKEYHFSIRGKVLYYGYSKEFDGKRRAINFEKILGVSGTSRTWKVINHLIELSQSNKKQR